MEVFAVLASVQSMGLTGIQGYPVTVEAYCVDGMPMFEIVGLPDAAVKESRERVRAAMSACHTPFPVARLTLNLAPADVRKEGPAYDLPIALAILASMGRLDAETMAGMAAVGELSLSGGVMGVRGALSMAIAARESGLRAIMLPASNAAEAACIEGLDVLPVAHLSEAIDHLRGRRRIEPLRARPYAELLGEKKILCDFADVRGQKGAKRALEIAAAGGHNVLMIGPPGSGKTMMARCLPGILPDMTLEEALEVLYLRDDDIPQAVAMGVADLGIVGLNEVAEKGFRVEQAMDLGFGNCRISLAVERTLAYEGLDYFRGKRVATSYPNILTRFFAEKGIDAEIHTIEGSVEIAPAVGMSDAIFDIVSSGGTLISNGLVEVEKVFYSEAVLIANPEMDEAKRRETAQLTFRFNSILESRGMKYVLMNLPAEKLQEAIVILPGMRSPTILPLAQEGWCSIHAVISESQLWERIERLKEIGAEDILVLTLENMIR